MQIHTVGDVRAAADRAFASAQFEEALALYTTVLAAEPDHLDARLRMADCLLARGEVQRAAVVYTTLARHAAQAGYPLRALAAIRLLGTLEPALLSLVRVVADLYAIDAGRIGRGARPVPASEAGPVRDSESALARLRGAELVAAAETLGKDVSRCRIRYPEVLPPIPLLSELGRDDFERVLEAVTLVRRRAGETVIQQGDAGHSFFLVVRGELEVAREDAAGASTRLASLYEGAVVGEMALLARSPRTAHVRAVSDADLLELGVEALGQVSHGAAAIARALDKFTRERLITNLISTAALFKPLDRTQRIDLVRRFVAHEIAAGTDVIREGEPGTGLYVVLQGGVDVSKRDGNEKVLLATLGPGEVFGEMSLLRATPASATVSAAQRSTVLFLAREYVEKLITTVPALGAYLESLGDEREMDTRMWLDASGASASQQDEIDVDLEL